MSTGVPLLDGLLTSIMGEQAQFSLLDREAHTAMAMALGLAEQAVGGQARVVWVDNGPGSLFSLPQPEPGTVVVSARAIEFTDLIRKILVSGELDGRFEAAAEQTFFGIAAEQALLQGHVDAAVKALAMSSTAAPGVYLPIQGLHALSSTPVNVGDVATWCFGLLHEVGHLSGQDEDFAPLTNDDVVIGQLEWLSRSWMQVPTAEVGDPILRAKDQSDSSIIGLNHVRSEIAADLFATHLLMLTTETLMSEVGERVDWAVFIREAHAAQQVVATFDRLKRAAALGESSAPTREEAIEMMFHPLSIGVRNIAQQEYLAATLSVRNADSARSAGSHDIQRQRAFIRGSIAQQQARYEVIDRALDVTVDFMLNRQRQADQWQLIDRLLSVRESAYDPFITRFVDLAEGMGHHTKATRALRRLFGQGADPDTSGVSPSR